jgi:hypothetical protein
MKPCVGRWVCVCLLVAVGGSRGWAGDAVTRLVSDEFREKLAKVSAQSVRPPDALDFAAQQARFVRVAIHETSGNSQPGIDELEVYGPAGKDNLALAERGAVASASSVLPGYAIHQIKHLNDGRYGNDHSWIAASREREWVQIELPEPAAVGRVVITRDRSGKYRDRMPEVFEVLVSQDGQQWQSVAKRDRTGANRARRIPLLHVDRLP